MELPQSYYNDTDFPDVWKKGTGEATSLAFTLASLLLFPTCLTAALITDFFFQCSTRRTARAVASFNVPTYLYQFSFDMSNWIEYPLLHDYHTSEIPFVFRNEWPPLVHHFDANDWKMSDAMSSFWTNMAATGDPNKGPQSVPLTWPLYANATNENIQVTNCACRFRLFEEY